MLCFPFSTQSVAVPCVSSIRCLRKPGLGLTSPCRPYSRLLFTAATRQTSAERVQTAFEVRACSVYVVSTMPGETTCFSAYAVCEKYRKVVFVCKPRTAFRGEDCSPPIMEAPRLQSSEASTAMKNGTFVTNVSNCSSPARV